MPHDTTHIPEGWRETTLGEVVDILDGDRGSSYPNGDDFSDKGFCLFLNTKNVPNTKFSFSEKMFITEAKDNLLRKGKLQRGDYVMTTRGTIGNFAYYHDKIEFDHIRINSGMVILRVNKNEIDEVFFGQYLDSILFRHQFTSLQSGSAVPQLPIRDIKTFSILLPPLPEQLTIANMLSSLDAKIELLREQNETLEKTAQTIFHEWFGRYSVEILGELPEGWRVGKLREVLRLSYGKALKSEHRTNKGFPVVGSSGVVGYHDEYFVEGPGIVVGRKGNMGSVLWIEESFYPIDTTFFVEDLLDIGSLEYHLMLLKSLDFSKIGSDSAVPGLNRDAAYSKEIILPNKESVIDFINIIKPVFQKIQTNNSQIQSLSKTRDTLLPKLMGGEVRVI